MARREFKIERIALAFFITLVIFLAGILLGTAISSGKISFLSQDIETASASTEGMELQFLIADTVGTEAACKYLLRQSETISDQTDALGQKLTLAEEGGKYGPSFTGVKEVYTSLLIKDWLIFSRMKTACKTNQTIILYFYNNKDCDQCFEQGAVLTYLKRKLDGNILVFPIDTALDMPLVNLLEEIYGVKNQPTLVINGEVFGKFMSANELEEAMASDLVNA